MDRSKQQQQNRTESTAAEAMERQQDAIELDPKATHMHEHKDEKTVFGVRWWTDVARVYGQMPPW